MRAARRGGAEGKDAEEGNGGKQVNGGDVDCDDERRRNYNGRLKSGAFVCLPEAAPGLLLEARLETARGEALGKAEAGQAGGRRMG